MKLNESSPVPVIFLALTHELVQYDERLSRRESKRGRPNIYRLGHYLAATQRAEDFCNENGGTREALIRALRLHFDGLPPVDKILRKIAPLACEKCSGLGLYILHTFEGPVTLKCSCREAAQ